MKKILLLTLLVLFFVDGTNAQRKSKQHAVKIKSSVLIEGKDGLYVPPIPGLLYVMVSGLGPAYLFGDVGGSLQEQALFGANDWDVLNTRFLFSLGTHHIFPNHLAVKFSLYYGRFAGTDANSRNAVREYAFQSNIFTGALQGEYIFWGGPYSRFKNPHCLYFFAGIGLMSSNSISTGLVIPPNFRNSALAPVIPIGIGYQFQFTDKLSFGAEFGWHYIESDYADGVHTINSKSNDALSFLSLTLAYKIYGSVDGLKNRCNCQW